MRKGRTFLLRTCAGEEVVSIFVEGHCHDPVSEVEGFLDPVTMVDVNINVEHPRVVPGVRAKTGSEAEVDSRKKTPATPPKHKLCDYQKSASAQLHQSHLKPNTTSSLRATLGLQPRCRDRRGMCREG